MKAIEILNDEHRIIEQGLGVLENVTRRVVEGEPMPPGKLEELLDFFANYADKIHHGKEERLLVPQMEDRCGGRYLGPHNELLDRMEQEHKEGRALIARMGETWTRLPKEPRAKDEFVAASRNYTHMLRGHIRMEEEDLFPEMENLLSDYDRSLTEAYERQEREEIGEGVPEKYHRTVEELAKELSGG